MSIWIRDVEDYSGAEAAAKGGMYASLGFAALLLLGLILLLTGVAPMPGLADPWMKYFSLAVLVVEMAIALFAAWRFRLGKGWVAGSATLLVFAIEIVFKILGGFVGILWYVAYLAIFLGLANGIRGAWALRSMGGAGDLVQTFR